MSVEKVRAYLEPFGVADRMREFEVSSATVELAAVAVGVEPARIAKTLSFKIGEDPILIVAAGDAKIDNSKYKHFFGTKAKMLTPDEAIERIGHAVGGVCPFALPADVKPYLDVSLRRFETVFPAVGSAASAAAAQTSPRGSMCARRGRVSSNMVKVLHAADFHLDSAFGALPEEKARLRRRESRGIPARLVEWANDHGAQLMLLAGDLFDSDNLYGQTAQELADALGPFHGRVFIAPGNHDFYAAHGPWGAAAWPENVHIFTSGRPVCVDEPARPSLRRRRRTAARSRRCAAPTTGART